MLITFNNKMNLYNKLLVLRGTLKITMKLTDQKFHYKSKRALLRRISKEMDSHKIHMYKHMKRKTEAYI